MISNGYEALLSYRVSPSLAVKPLPVSKGIHGMFPDITPLVDKLPSSLCLRNAISEILTTSSFPQPDSL